MISYIYARVTLYSSKVITRAYSQTTQKIKNALKEGWQPRIGLEIHSQINSKSKLFSFSSTNYYSPPNSNVSFFDCSLPGTLPVINRYCIEAAILTGLALNCQISSKCSFDRKHYFYPDLPFGYQITQKNEPIAKNGYLNFVTIDSHAPSYDKTVKLTQIQLEQDSGKTLHDFVHDQNLVDLNRSGIGLMEFVFEPDIYTAQEAVSLVRELICILKRLNVCSCKMEEGALRIDANVSIHRLDQPLGIRTEIKNLNSLNSLSNAINYEILRHIHAIKTHKEILQETRFFDSSKRKTVSIREKEVIQDYRYISEPNLPPLVLKEKQEEAVDDGSISIEKVQKQLPSLPSQERKDLLETYNISLEVVQAIVSNNLYQFFLEILQINPFSSPKAIGRYLSLEFLDTLDQLGLTLDDIQLNTKYFAQCCDLLECEVITHGMFHDILVLMIQGDERSPKKIVSDYKWMLIQNPVEINAYCSKAIECHPKTAYYAKIGKLYHRKKLLSYVENYSDKRIARNKIEESLMVLLEQTSRSDLKKMFKELKKKESSSEFDEIYQDENDLK